MRKSRARLRQRTESIAPMLSSSTCQKPTRNLFNLYSFDWSKTEQLKKNQLQAACTCTAKGTRKQYLSILKQLY
jgi:hypothetical protein